MHTLSTHPATLPAHALFAQTFIKSIILVSRRKRGAELEMGIEEGIALSLFLRERWSIRQMHCEFVCRIAIDRFLSVDSVRLTIVATNRVGSYLFFFSITFSEWSTWHAWDDSNFFFSLEYKLLRLENDYSPDLPLFFSSFFLSRFFLSPFSASYALSSVALFAFDFQCRWLDLDFAPKRKELWMGKLCKLLGRMMLHI